MATLKQLETKQSALDIQKWTDSENGTDMCGTYDYCDKCDKEKDFPCARAFYAKNATTKTTKTATKKATAKK
ncbi:MAG: hypothetical protein K2P12_03535 [Clostridia bacterium]|nr:hypothetical protein [Clostridia bacterium]